MGACSSCEDCFKVDPRLDEKDASEGMNEVTWFKSGRISSVSGLKRAKTEKLAATQKSTPSREGGTKRRHQLGSIAKKAQDKMWHADIDECVRRIEENATAAHRSELAEHRTMLHASEMFTGEWLDMLRAIGSDCAEVGTYLDMVYIGDFGNDDSGLDDEQALTM